MLPLLLYYSNTVLNTKRNQLSNICVVFPFKKNNKNDWRNVLRELEVNYTKSICMQKKTYYYFFFLTPPFSRTPFQDSVQCPGERLTTLKCKHLLKDVLQLTTAILRHWLLTQVLLSSIEWQFLLKCGNRALYGT